MNKKLFICLLCCHASIGLTLSAQAQDWATWRARSIASYKHKNLDSAIIFETKALEAAEKEFGKTDTVYASTLAGLGYLFVKKGEYQKSEQLYLDALKIRRLKLDDENPGYITLLNALGALYQTNGDLNKTEVFFKETLAIRERNGIKDSIGYAQSLNTLGLLYRDKKDFNLAESYLVKSLDINRKVLKPDNPDFAASLINLGDLFFDEEKYTQAESLYTEALSVRKSAPDAPRPDYGSILERLGSLNEAMENNPAAEKYFLESLRYRNAQLVKNYPAYARTLGELGYLYESTGRYNEAERILTEALTLEEKIFGGSSSAYGISANNLGVLYNYMGHYDKSKALFLTALPIIKYRFGGYSQNYIECLNNLADLYSASSQNREADSVLNQILNIAKTNSNNRAYLLALDKLANFYKNTGSYKKAEPLLLQSLAIKKKSTEYRKLDYAKSLNDLAVLYRYMGDYVRADSLSELSLVIQKKTLPHFIVQEKFSNYLLKINAGQSLDILTGAKVNFYEAFKDTSAETKLGSGRITSSNSASSQVKLNDSIAEAPENIWAYVQENKPGALAISLKLNTSYPYQKNKEIFSQLMDTLRKSSIAKYMTFADRGGEIRIGEIEKNQDNRYILPFFDPRSGVLFEKVKIDSVNKIDAITDLILRHARYNYLYRIKNNVPWEHLDVYFEKYNDSTEVETDNGYPVLYDKDKIKLNITNQSKDTTYYAVIDLLPDRSFKVIFSGTEQSDISFLKGGESKKIALTIPQTFGVERYKVISSAKPFSLQGFKDGNVATRGSKSSPESFYAETVNIQDFDFEIRSRAYAKNKEKKVSLKSSISTISDTGRYNYTLTNPSAQGVYFNLLKQESDGSFTTIFPSKSVTETACFVRSNRSFDFHFSGLLHPYQQLITVYSDRPFQLDNYVPSEGSINNLLTEIIRTGRISGSALNKISILQNLFIPEGKGNFKGANDLLITLINPKMDNDGKSIIEAKGASLDINGFALEADGSPVKIVKINSEVIPYNTQYKAFFQYTLFLEEGDNKVVIEAQDEKGFSVFNKFEVTYHDNQAGVAKTGRNYFLGIGIDKYINGWSKLNNATNDVKSFARMLQSRYKFAEKNVTLLLDSEATRKNIIKYIRHYISICGPNDNFVIYLSGHGNDDPLVDGDYYFIPEEGDPSDISTDVKSTDILAPFKKITARHCVLIIDACYAGMIANDAYDQGQPAMDPKSSSLPIEKQPSKWIISSGRATKVSDGEPGKDSPFATVLLNYLSEGNEDRARLKITRIIELLKERVPQINNLQMPMGVKIYGFGEPLFPIFDN